MARAPATPARRGAPAWLAPGALAALLLAVVIAPALLAAVGRPASSVYEARGYRTLVNELVAGRGWLKLDTRAEPMRVIPSEWAPVDDPAFRAFLNGSYLAADMKKADASVWRVEEGGTRVLAIRPDAHRILGPFATGRGWNGSLLYRGDRQATPVLVARATGAELSLVAQGESHAAAAAQTIALDGAPPRGARAAQRYAFTHDDETAAVVLRAGDQTLVQVFAAEGVSVMLEGRTLAPREGAPLIVPMRPHDTLGFRHDNRETRFDLDLADPAISRSLPGRGRVRDAGLDSFARAAEGAMGEGDDNRIQLTIDSGLQAAAQTALETRAERLRAGGPGFPAGVTLMDARTGEVLALGTYPRDRSQLSGRQAASLEPDPLIQRNHNFDRLPVGSVAKVPFSLAILQSNPSLATLRLQPAQVRALSTDRDKTKRSFRELLGVDIGMDIEDHVTAEGGLDFRSFLEKSSNKYAAALMLLALGDGSAMAGASEPWSLDGQTRGGPPALAILRGAPRGPYGLVPRPRRDVAVGWAGQLPALFAVRAEGDASGEASAFDTGAWGRMGLERRERFAAASPEIEDFGLSDIGDIGPDYIMSILGGARGRWTTVKMAEAFSRIVTRRPVRSQFVAGARPVAAGERLAIRDEAWRPVMEGMAAVAGPGGTGHALGEAAPRPLDATLEVRLFAKTGTPNLDRFGARTQANAALARYVERGCPLAWRRGVGLYLPQAGLRAGRDKVFDAVKRLGARCHDGKPELVVQEVIRLNALGRARGGAIPGLTLANGQVMGIPTEAVSYSGIGHAVAVVAGLYRSGAPDDQPIRALSMVVNLQQRTEADKTPAVGVATRLLCDPAVRAWLIGGPSRAGAGCAR
ncbi:MAG: hypothetical protein K1X35_14660 [Caulobacteraceae bacterium]|nr:hypothetical protein [Caulobacteraceae bacterium]